MVDKGQLINLGDLMKRSHITLARLSKLIGVVRTTIARWRDGHRCSPPHHKAACEMLWYINNRIGTHYVPSDVIQLQHIPDDVMSSLDPKLLVKLAEQKSALPNPGKYEPLENVAFRRHMTKTISEWRQDHLEGRFAV